MDQKFKIIIPGYNCEKFVKQCIDSVLNQSYQNFKICILNDGSTDNTKTVIEPYLKDNRIMLVNKVKNVGALNNIVDGINLICNDPEEIIVLLDMDDFLYSSDVLEYLNNIYQDQGLFCTFGQYLDSYGAIGLSQPLTVHSSMIRDIGLQMSHLRTFKYKLWKHIKDEDLKDKNGNYYMMTYDVAILMPMVELAGNKRIKFIDKIMYFYRNGNDNPNNDYKKNVNLQWSIDREIRQKPRYQELP